MLLVEITINSTLYRVSNEDLPLEHLWKAEVVSLSSLGIAMDEKYGGYVRPDFGDIVFLPSIFDNEWMPPVSCEIVIKYTETTEAAAETIFTGTAHLNSIARDGVTYGLYAKEYTATWVGAINMTLVNTVSFACETARLNLTLNSTLARSSSPTVDCTIRDSVVIDELSKICASCSHYFYISGSTLHLVDTKRTATATTYTEFDIFPSQYDYPNPISQIISGDFTVFGSHAYGEPKTVGGYNVNETPALAAMADIKTFLEMPEVTWHMPIKNAPTIGEFITIKDESNEGDITATALVQETVFDFDSDIVTVRGVFT